MKTQICAKNLVKEFEVRKKKSFLGKAEVSKFKAVDNIDLNIDEGEIVAFIGPNGAGKSTTIKMLTGIIHSTSGEISVNGLNPIKDRKELSYQIGCMFGQKSQLYMHLTVMDSLKLIGSIYDMDNEKLSAQIEYISNLFDIEHLLYRTVKSLSLGQRMICEIAGSIMHEPKIIFLDEPTIGLDVIAKQNVRDVIKKLNKEKNVTIFLTSHDVGDVEAICDRLIVINHGKVIKDESIVDIQKEYSSKKNITIYTSCDVSGCTFSKIENVEVFKNVIKIQIDTKEHDIVELIKYFSERVKIEDIRIQSKSMEEIITEIYEGEKKHE